VTGGAIAYAEGISIRDYGAAATEPTVSDLNYARVSPLGENSSLKGGIPTIAPTSISIANATFTGVDEPGSYGVACWALGEDVNVTVTNSDVTGWEYGFVVYEAGSLVTASATTCTIASNLVGVWTNAVVDQNFEGNWWGYYCGPLHDPTNLNGWGNEVSDYVDFIPWCDETFTTCDFTPAPPAEVWVDDDYSPTAANDGHLWCYDAFDQITDGIDRVDAGSTVNVSGGTYSEQILIDKDIALVGSGDPIIEPPVDPLVEYTIEESGRTFYPMLFAYGGTDDGTGYVSGSGTITADISGFEFDGNNSATTTSFVAMLLRNCVSSTIYDNDFYELLQVAPNPQTFGIMVYGASDVVVQENTVDDWIRGGIGILGDDGPLADPTAQVLNNTVIGEGPVPLGSWAQNGIQVSVGAHATVTGNTVSGIAIFDDPDWAASAINIYLAADGTSLSGNTVYDSEAAIYCSYTNNVTIDGNHNLYDNDFTFILGGDNIVFDGNTLTGNNQGLYIGDATNVAVSNCSFTGNDYAFLADGLAADITVTGCDFAGSGTTAFYIDEYASDEPTGIVINGNSIAGNAFGVNNYTSVMTDAMSNWWGDVSGPASVVMKAGVRLADRPRQVRPVDSPVDLLSRTLREVGEVESVEGFAGTGDQVSANVDYSPWWGANYLGDDHTSPWEWYVDNSNSSTIQEGVDWAANGDNIWVTDGEYDAPINIDTRTDLTISGINLANALFTPISTYAWDVGGYGSSRQAAIRVVGSTDITLSALTMDFTAITDNNYFGVFFWNSEGELSGNVLKNMSIDDASGIYYEIMGYYRAPDFTDVDRANISFLNNTFEKTGRLAICTHQYVDALIEGNSFDMVDPNFGYAIEIGSESIGTIRDNTFQNYNTWALTDQSASGAIYVENAYTGSTPHLDKAVLIEENEVSSCQWGVIVGNEFPGFAGDVDIQVTMQKNFIHDNATTGSYASGGVYLTDEGRDVGSSVSAVIDSNRLVNNGDFGISIVTDGNGDITAAITKNLLEANYNGLVVKNYGDAAGSAYSLDVYRNTFDNNLNAEDDVGGGFWDDGSSVGNCWSDITENPGYPTQYEVPGNAGTVDRYPTCWWLCDCTMHCDLNIDGNINPTDVVLIVNWVYKAEDMRVVIESCWGENGDWNCDDAVNPTDVVHYVNFVYKGFTYGPCDPCGPPPAPAKITASSEPASNSTPERGEAILAGPQPVQ